MREAVRRAARALLPVALCVALALLETHLASTQPTPPSSTPPTPPLPFRNPYAPATPPPHSYFANDSLLGRRVPCTDEEKECLRYNRIYSPVRGHCYALGEGPGRCGIVVDACEFHSTGHVRGTCAPADACAPYARSHVRMAFDGRCVEMNRLKTVCGPGPVNIALHFFGDAECAPTQLLAPPPAAPPVAVRQPEERGACAFPNLRHDLTAFAYDEFFRACSEEQSVCFARQTAWVNATRTCHALLERGPCEEGERVVLSRAAWEAGDVQATCAPVNPCSAEDHRLMAFDGRCYDAPTILRVLCPSGVLLPNAFGEMACVRRDYYRHVILLQSPRPRTCALAHRVSHDLPTPGTLALPDCALSGKRSCPDAF